MNRVGFWLQEIRAPFLSLSAVLIFLGTSVAYAEGAFVPFRAILALAGLVLLHVSVNLFNEYSDFHSGIDFQTARTPFSGGSGMITSGKIAPGAVKAVAVGSLILGVAIGLYFLHLTNPWLLPLLLVGGFSVYFYTDLLARHALGEAFAGLGLGLLPVLGAHFVQTGRYSIAAFAAAIPAGILTFNLLLLNEFPDLDADRAGGRKNLLILFGRARGGRIYTILFVVMYLWIVCAVLVGFLPVYCLAGLFTIPLALKPMKWAWAGGGPEEEMIPCLGANVMTNLATQVLLGLGFIAAALLS
jgi:1,4-dihydroxy-2-naphthoate octaprenyltransferase